MFSELPKPSFIERQSLLIEREQRTRFAGGPLGFFWAFVGPISWIAFVVVFFRLIGRTPPLQGGVEVFVTTGILPYALCRQNISFSARSMISNRQMVAYPAISPLDLLTSNAALEYMANFLTFAILFAGCALLFSVPAPASWHTVMYAIFATWSLGVGFGSLLAAFSLVSDSFHRAEQHLMRPLFWISGLFYTATELPESSIAVFRWNPLFHCIDGLREGMFLGFESPIANLWYPVVFGGACFILSAPIIIYIERKRLARHSI